MLLLPGEFRLILLGFFSLRALELAEYIFVSERHRRVRLKCNFGEGLPEHLDSTILLTYFKVYNWWMKDRNQKSRTETSIPLTFLPLFYLHSK